MRPSVLRFSRRVWCGRGLNNEEQYRSLKNFYLAVNGKVHTRAQRQYVVYCSISGVLYIDDNGACTKWVCCNGNDALAQNYATRDKYAMMRFSSEAVEYTFLIRIKIQGVNKTQPNSESFFRHLSISHRKCAFSHTQKNTSNAAGNVLLRLVWERAQMRICGQRCRCGHS